MTNMQNNHEIDSIVIDLQYFTCINWIKIWREYSNLIILSNETYQKMTFRNRCVIAGSNGLINLSVPVEEGRNVRLPFQEVKISYKEKWQLQQWRTIVSCYNRSPWFEYYRDNLEIFFKTEFEYLFQLNMEILRWLSGILKLKLPLIKTSGADFDTLDFRNKWLPKNFQEEKGIRYHQLFEERIGFQTNLSVLDLLFMEGPNISNILSK